MTYFLCGKCAQKEKEHWDKKNLYLTYEGRGINDKHIIAIAKIIIEAKDKKMFKELAQNEVQNQINFWVPKKRY